MKAESQKYNNDKDSSRLRWVIGSLCAVQVILIAVVASIIGINFSKHKSFKKTVESDFTSLIDSKLDQKLPVRDSMYLSNTEYSQIVQNAYSEAFDYLASDMAGLETLINESNSFSSILLALITLCVTLAVVIPYIVGRAVSEGKIKEVAGAIVRDEVMWLKQENKAIQGDLENRINTSYEESVKQIDDNYDKTVSQINTTLQALRWSEAHTSRLIGYLLRYKTEDKKTLSYSRINEICWSVGWLSKALARYIIVSDGSKRYHAQQFVDDAQEYILSVKPYLSQLTLDKDEVIRKQQDLEGKTLRAFIDLFDVFQFYEWKNRTGNQELLKLSRRAELLGLLKAYYRKLSEFGGMGYDYKACIKDALEKKAKHREYMPNDNSFLTTAHEWLFNNNICDKGWNPSV